MLKAEIKKSDFEGIIGLSCIENYLLAALKANNVKFGYLYYRSFVSFEQIFTDFFTRKVQYAFYYTIRRLQKIAAEEKIIEATDKKIAEIDESFFNENIYSLLKIKPSFVEDKYKTSTWRDDHFLLIGKRSDNTHYYINDNPLDIGSIGDNEIGSIYDGQLFTFSILCKEFDEKQISNFYSYLSETLSEDTNDLDYALISVSDINEVRDFLGILRVSRKRVENFLSLYTDTSFMQDYLSELDKFYAKIEYLRLKKKFDIEDLITKIKELKNKDLIIVSQILKKIKGML